MTRLFLVKLLIFIVAIASFAQKKTIEIATYNGIKAIYEGQDGIFHGTYQSYYKNGQKCAEGRFENNFRIGEWSVWDSTGKLRVQRVYESPFVYKTTFPKTPSSPLIDLLNVPKYRPTRSTDGCIDYHFIHERMVFFERRIWRYLPNDNRNLHWIKSCFNHINSMVLKKEIRAYNNDEFEEEITFDSMLVEKGKFIGFKIKEVYFFDTDRFLSESRILGICPVIIDEQKNDTIDLYWVYYPETRSLLAQEKFQDQSLNKTIQNYDDIFFFRYFSSYVYMQSSFYGKVEKNAPVLSKRALEKKSDEIEVNHVESEHMFWITFSRNE